MTTPAWRRYKETATYKVYKTGDWLFPYTVTTPRGRVLGVAMTLAGARRLIKRHKTEDQFWERDLVWEQEP